MGPIEHYRRLPPAVRGWFPYVGLAAAVMFLVGILGAAVGAESTGGTIMPIRDPGQPAPDLSTWGLFSHNAGLAIRSALGVLSFGVYTTWVLLLNGFVLGAVIADVVAAWGPGRTLLALAPHGVFELPAFCMSGAIGFRWLATVWAVAQGDRDRIPVPRLVLESVLLTVVVLVMLFVAAAIEANVSVALV